MRKTVLMTGLIVAATIIVGARATSHAEAATNQPSESKQVIVKIQSGDSLSKIAKKHDTTYTRIFDANTFIKDPNVIYPGDKVRIPNKDEKLKSRLTDVRQKKTSPKKTSSSNKLSNKYTYTPKQNGRTVSGSVWDRLAACESGGNWSINTGNGYYGGLQFSAATWRSVGGSGLPHQASKAEQIKRGQILQARSGWGQWPACTAKLDLR